MNKNLYFLIALFLITVSCGKKEQMRSKVYKNYNTQADSALKYAKKNGLSTDFFILVDLSLHSGKDRLYIWDFKKKKVTNSFLSMHGSGKKRKSDNVTFSNDPKSYSSSLGKYVIAANKQVSLNYGFKYQLEGKDATNSNAVRRMIVLHPSKYVPNKEVYPRKIGKSRGCPAVSKGAFKFIDRKIQKSDQQVLLWVIG